MTQQRHNLLMVFVDGHGRSLEDVKEVIPQPDHVMRRRLGRRIHYIELCWLVGAGLLRTRTEREGSKRTQVYEITDKGREYLATTQRQTRVSY